MIWAYIAHRDGYFIGAIAVGDMPPKWVADNVHDFLMDGCAIMATHTREEYERELAKLKCLSESPEWKAKHEPAQNELPL